MCYAEQRDDPYLALVRALYGADDRLADRRADPAESRLRRTMVAAEPHATHAAAPAALHAAADRLTRDAAL